MATVRERLISAGLDEPTVNDYLTDGWVRVDGERVTDGNTESNAGIVLLPPRG